MCATLFLPLCLQGRCLRVEPVVTTKTPLRWRRRLQRWWPHHRPLTRNSLRRCLLLWTLPGAVLMLCLACSIGARSCVLHWMKPRKRCSGVSVAVGEFVSSAACVVRRSGGCNRRTTLLEGITASQSPGPRAFWSVQISLRPLLLGLQRRSLGRQMVLGTLLISLRLMSKGQRWCSLRVLASLHSRWGTQSKEPRGASAGLTIRKSKSRGIAEMNTQESLKSLRRDCLLHVASL